MVEVTQASLNWAVRLPLLSALLTTFFSYEWEIYPSYNRHWCVSVISLLTFISIGTTFIVSSCSIKKNRNYGVAVGLNSVSALFTFAFFVVHAVSNQEETSKFYDFCFTCIFIYSLATVFTTTLYVIASLTFLQAHVQEQKLSQERLPNSLVVAEGKVVAPV
jgi:glycopeptide antibiotics resistance protein